MIGRGVRQKSSGFDYRGSHELARFSRCVWTQRVLQIGPLVIPLAPWQMVEEIVVMRGPDGNGWTGWHEREYRRRLVEVAA